MSTKSTIGLDEVKRLYGPGTPSMSVVPFRKRAKTRRIYNLLGCGTDVSFGVHNSDLNTTCRGILERVFFVLKDGVHRIPPKPDKALFNQRLERFKCKLLKALARTTTCLHEFTYDEFVLQYRGRRKTIYQNAVDSLLVCSVNRKDAVLKTFVKAEKVNFTSKPDPAPRVIQPRNPRYNVEVGRYLKKYEHFIYRGVAKVYGDVTISKGLNSAGTAKLIWEKWSSYRNPVAVGLDASRFDQHVSETALRWEHSVYNDLFHSPKLAKLLSWQIVNKGVAYCRDGKAKYSINGCRMSGDMNTALGNCVVMCGLVHAFLESVGVKGAKLINNGDDCVVFCESKYLNRFKNLDQWFHAMGFTMKVEEPVYEMEHIEFCQARPVYDGDHWVMMRDIKTCLAKDLITVKNVEDEKSWNRARNSIGQCGESLTGNLPIMGEFYRMLQRGAGDKIFNDELSTGMQFMARGMNQTGNISAAARYSVWRAFGILPDAQEEIERFYRAQQPMWQRPIPVEKYTTELFIDKLASK